MSELGDAGASKARSARENVARTLASPLDLLVAQDGADPANEVRPLDGSTGADTGFARLKWLAIVVPLVFVAVLHVLIHTVLNVFHDFPGVLVVFLWVSAGIVVFSFGVFWTVGRLERRILEQNSQLAALLSAGRAATSASSLSEMVEEALRSIVEVTSADSGEVWLATDDGCLVLEQALGVPLRAARLGSPLEPAAATSADGRQLDLAPSVARLEAQTAEAGFPAFVATPLRHRGAVLGLLALAAREPGALSSAGERRLLTGVGEQLAVAIANARLQERVLDRAVLEERERIARELHDGLAQVLGYINTQTQAIRKLIDSGRTETAQEQLHTMEDAARSVYTDVREAILGLRASRAPAAGLIPSLRRYASDFNGLAGFPVEVDVAEGVEEIRLPASTEIQLVRIVQEGLSNVRKHAQAGSARVRLDVADDRLRVAVVDDGRGFRLDRLGRTGWPRFGLRTMRERAEAIGGDFEIVSQPGGGTVVTVCVPLTRTAEVVRASAASR